MTSKEMRVGCSGLYVDVENLGEHSQTSILALLNDWPASVPKPSRSTLLVPADRVELWRVWAEHQMQPIRVIVRGVQHFSANDSKNAADIALAVDAIAEFVAGEVDHIVVLTDDSDLMNLYRAVRERAVSRSASSTVPFSWVATNRRGMLSSLAGQFLPSNVLHVLKLMPGVESDSLVLDGSGTAVEEPETEYEIAREIIASNSIGRFKSTDCLKIIKAGWPNHPLLRLDKPQFGVEFAKQIGPHLQALGVRTVEGRKPRQYENTAEAKQRVANTGS